MNTNEMLDQKLDELEDEKNYLEKNVPIENGDTILFLTSLDDDILIGKVVSEYNCVITTKGTVIGNEFITDKFLIPFNIIQERATTEEFNKAYESLRKLNDKDFKTQMLEDYIENSVVRNMGTLSDDRQFLVGLFTRNARNEKIDFKTYKFIIQVLFDYENDIIQYEPRIDLRELNSICFNILSIMNKISKETYDEIYNKLAYFANENNVII